MRLRLEQVDQAVRAAVESDSRRDRQRSDAVAAGQRALIRDFLERHGEPAWRGINLPERFQR